MKYLQLTLRDFFWLTIVVGLTIGIVIERNEVRSLRIYQGKAQWWEEAAKEFAEEVEKQTGIKTDFQEGAGASCFGHITLIKPPNHLVGTPLQVIAWSTEDKSYFWPTGMVDLNMMFILGPMVLICSLIDSILGGERKRQAQALLYAKMRPYAWGWSIGVIVSLLLASVCFLGSGPFFATMALLYGALCALNYWRCKQAPPAPATTLPV